MTRLAPCRCGHPGVGCSCYEERRAEAEAADRPVTSPARGGPDTAGTREAIEDALWRYSFGGWVTSSATVGDVARTLLPVVQRLAVEKAAEELRAAADADDAKPTRWPGSSGEWLRARAAALAAAAQPGDGRTGE